jgi:hypothetical protein
MRRVYKTSYLAPEERVAVERLIGPSLDNEEAVELMGRRNPNPPREYS